MARPLRIQYPGAYYHVTCRGNERRNIFADEKDISRFFEKLAVSLEIYNVILLAYVCMRNHFHLIIKTPRGNLSEFMRHFNISYTTVFNHRHGRSGNLYQGRYKAFLIDADSYLIEVSRYIHLNPIRTKASARKGVEERWRDLLKYPWSSLQGYLAPKKRVRFLNCGDTILRYVGGDNSKGREEYRQFLNMGLMKGLKNPMDLARGHGIIGDKGFVKWVKGKFLNDGVSRREQPAARELGKKVDSEDLISRYLQVVGKRREDVCRKGRHLLERSMLMELLYRLANISQRQIGELLGGINYSRVSQVRKKFQGSLAEAPRLRVKFDKLVNQLLEK
ncbi:MAG: transposase [Candidatus Aureabacteria bacterium]|nr:transposase [Candidatus Auribacterota bacterium]